MTGTGERVTTGERFERLRAVAVALAAAPDPERVAEVIVAQVVQALGGTGGFLMALAPDGAMLELLGAAGIPDDLARAWRRIPLDAEIPLAKTVRRGEPDWPEPLERRIARFPHLAGLYEAAGRRMWLSLPLAIESRRVGGFSVAFEEGHPFDEDERELALALASLSAVALDRARLHSAELRAASASQFLAEAATLLGESLDFAETVDAAARAAVPDIADWCAVDLVEAHGEVRRAAVHHHDPVKASVAYELNDLYAEDDEPGTVRAVLRTGEPYLVEHISPERLSELAKDGAHRAMLEALGFTSYMIVPLRLRRRLLGTLTLGTGDPERSLGRHELRLAEQLAERAALAIEHARLYREAQERADDQIRLSTALREMAEARDRALEEADAERGRLRTLFNQAPALIAVTRGPRHVFEIANPSFLRSVGIRNIIGLPVGEALPELRGQSFLEHLDAVYASGQPLFGNEVLTRVDRNGDGRFDADEHGYFNFVYQPYRDAGGAVAGVMIHAVNVTEQVRAREALAESEARLRLALRAARMGIWDWDIIAGRITWSEQVEALHGMAPGSFDGSFEMWTETLHPDDRERVIAQVQRALADRTVYESEFRAVRQDGTLVWLYTQGQATYDDSGRPVRMLGGTYDVSARKDTGGLAEGDAGS